MTTMDDCLQITRRTGFWFARLNRPEKRNALSEELVRALTELCSRVNEDLDARGLVLYGAGGNFCAGADLSRFLELMASEAGHAEDAIAADNRGFGAMLEALAGSAVPTVAVVRGSALGGGCGLAAACDHVIATDDAVFAMPEVTLGVAPAQIAPFVARRLGTTRARWLMLTARRLSAVEARSIGLCDTAVGAAELGPTVAAVLRDLGAAEPAALRATRRIVDRAGRVDLPAALDDAAREFAGLLRHGGAREGIAALRERRAPAWRVELTELPDFQ